MFADDNVARSMTSQVGHTELAQFGPVEVAIKRKVIQEARRRLSIRKKVHGRLKPPKKNSILRRGVPSHVISDVQDLVNRMRRKAELALSGNQRRSARHHASKPPIPIGVTNSERCCGDAKNDAGQGQ